jgi:hypothetical protein
MENYTQKVDNSASKRVGNSTLTGGPKYTGGKFHSHAMVDKLTSLVDNIHPLV